MGRMRLTIVALSTATLLATAGCGSSAKPLTRAELTVKANAICKTVNTKLLVSTKRGGNNRQALARITSELASFEQSALAELSKLVPPTALEVEWKQLIAGAETLAENTARLGEYAKQNNLKGVHQLIASTEVVQHRMEATAKRLGLVACEQIA